MKIPSIFRLCLFCVLVALLALNACKATEEDQYEKDKEEVTPSPATTTKVLEAFAVGDAAYRYEDGLWTYDDSVPEDELPWFTVDFLGPDNGWAGGTGKIFHWDGDEWTKDSPELQYSSTEIRQVRIADSGVVYAYANKGPESGGLLMTRDPILGWTVRDLDDEYGGDTVVKDMLLLTDGVAILAQVDLSAAIYYYYYITGESGRIGVYTYDPLNFLDFGAMGASPDGYILVGGKKIDGVARTGFVWKREDNNAYAPQTLPAAGCPPTDVVRLVRSGSRTFMLGLCNYSVMYVLEENVWTEVQLPGEKDAEWRINNIAFLNSDTGFGVGYDSKADGAMFLLRDSAGWQFMALNEIDQNDVEDVNLNAVAVWSPNWEPPVDDTDDDTADDDTADDDTAA